MAFGNHSAQHDKAVQAQIGKKQRGGIGVKVFGIAEQNEQIILRGVGDTWGDRLVDGCKDTGQKAVGASQPDPLVGKIATKQAPIPAINDPTSSSQWSPV